MITARLSLLVSLVAAPLFAAQPPNIVLILADDMGYGDVQCLNPERGRIETPAMDQLAKEGMTFTDAHTSSAVCTPTRYGLLTGRYSWRTRLQRSVLIGYSEPLIAEDRLTVAGLLKKKGYATGMFGKWHLGLDLPTTDGERPNGEGMSNLDWKGEIKGGPHSLGFDHFFGISASLDMPPYIYLENDRFLGEGTTRKTWVREGVAEKDFEAVNVLDDLKREATEFIQAQTDSQPFFVYMPLPSPHTPIVPTEEWQGKSEIGAYGDFMMQTDALVGSMLKAVEDAGFGDNTLFILTSDNGCSRDADIAAMEEKGHFPSAGFRGSKADLWEGGHRVPFLVRWPGVVAEGSQSDEIICLNDFMATCAEVADAELPGNAGEDSVSFLPALKGQKIETSRKGIINHSIGGHFAYREGPWKLLLAKGSGGWSSPTERELKEAGVEAQLYDLDSDPGELVNLYESRPEVAARLLKQLEQYVSAGRSADGPAASNDVPEIDLWKSDPSK